jgi:anti-sigma-K factor RskA
LYWRWALAAAGLVIAATAGYFALSMRERPEPVVVAFAGSLTGALAPVGTEALRHHAKITALFPNLGVIV